jgi:hypothetical protein
VKDLPPIDPLSRSKRLFDVVDSSKKIGWSAKTLVWNFEKNDECEFVIQRADIFKKAQLLGFDTLAKDSELEHLGIALLKHWFDKVDEDGAVQGITQKKTVILLKNFARSRFVVLEEDLERFAPADIVWEWTNEGQVGLKGKLVKDNFVKYKWYANQKQLFERIRIPKEKEIIEIDHDRLDFDEVIRRLLVPQAETP